MGERKCIRRRQADRFFGHAGESAASHSLPPRDLIRHPESSTRIPAEKGSSKQHEIHRRGKDLRQGGRRRTRLRQLPAGEVRPPRGARRRRRRPWGRCHHPRLPEPEDPPRPQVPPAPRGETRRPRRGKQTDRPGLRRTWRSSSRWVRSSGMRRTGSSWPI